MVGSGTCLLFSTLILRTLWFCTILNPHRDVGSFRGLRAASVLEPLASELCSLFFAARLFPVGHVLLCCILALRVRFCSSGKEDHNRIEQVASRSVGAAVLDVVACCLALSAKM